MVVTGPKRSIAYVKVIGQGPPTSPAHNSSHPSNKWSGVTLVLQGVLPEKITKYCRWLFKNKKKMEEQRWKKLREGCLWVWGYWQGWVVYRAWQSHFTPPCPRSVILHICPQTPSHLKLVDRFPRFLISYKLTKKP